MSIELYYICDEKSNKNNCSNDWKMGYLDLYPDGYFDGWGTKPFISVCFVFTVLFLNGYAYAKHC